MTRRAKATASLPAKRGPGRPSNAEKARRAAELVMAAAAATAAIAPAVPKAIPPPPAPQVSDVDIATFILRAMTLPLPPEPHQAPILPPPPPPPPAPAPQPKQDLSLLAAHERENPDRLRGETLRHFAWQRGISRSEMEGWSDEKVREQVQILVRRQYNDQAYAEA